jgi:hypothetical protein
MEELNEVLMFKTRMAHHGVSFSFLNGFARLTGTAVSSGLSYTALQLMDDRAFRTGSTFESDGDPLQVFGSLY